jgi:hypothetical protein
MDNKRHLEGHILKVNRSCRLIICLFLFLTAMGIASPASKESRAQGSESSEYPAPEKNCLICHKGIEPITKHDAAMAQQIYTTGRKMGDPNGCTVCHLGNPGAGKDKNAAHKNLVRFSGSMWANKETCGQCHDNYAYALQRNLMETQAGIIQEALWGWGAPSDKKKIYGNYSVDDTDGPVPSIGSEKYKAYIKALMAKYPENYPSRLDLLPDADLASIGKKPEQAGYAYIRGVCSRCHLGVRGEKSCGDYRGMGCAACHIPYSAEGQYEGDDKTIPKDKPGHLLVHTIQSSRKAEVHVRGKSYSGIPSETCVACHNRGKEAGISYLGLMQSPCNAPFNKDGSAQRALHGMNYIFLKDDVHHNTSRNKGNPEGGLLCQDCHTTCEVHGNGNIGGTTLGEVEIECADCHGTPDKYPWELPLGFGDEFGIQKNHEQRGVASELLGIQKSYSTVYESEDGYLLTSRGNPFGTVVRRLNYVILHSAGGQDFVVPTLKEITIKKKWEDPSRAITAMVRTKPHIEKMECYACHSTWASQLYGSNVKVDYSKKSSGIDWIKAGNTHYPNGETAESVKGGTPPCVPADLTETKSYILWEDPILGINGEGMVTPLIPGCQLITTVIGPDGQVRALNKIWKTPPATNNDGNGGQMGIGMVALQPHTISLEARECTSCHATPKALGYGIADGRYMQGYEHDRCVDLRSSDGRVLSSATTPQITGVPDLMADLSQIVTRDGKQLQTVDRHWPLAGPLHKDQRLNMERTEICISCHRDIPNGAPDMVFINFAGRMIGLIPHTDAQHSDLLHKLLHMTAVVEIVAPPVVGFLILLYILWRVKLRKTKS